MLLFIFAIGNIFVIHYSRILDLSMQEENYRPSGRHISGSHQLISICTSVGSGTTILCLLFVFTLHYFGHSAVRTDYYLPFLGSMAILFIAGFLLNKKAGRSSKSNALLTRMPAAAYLYLLPLFLTDITLACIAGEAGGVLLFIVWQLLTIITVPYFRALNKTAHIVFVCLLQLCNAVLLNRLLHAAEWVWAIPVLLFSSLLMLLGYWMVNRFREESEESTTAFQPGLNHTEQQYEDTRLDQFNKNKTLDKLIHDFRNPLANIQLLADYVQQYTTETKEAGNELQMIIESCQQLNTLLDDTLIKMKQEMAEAS